MNIGPLTHSMCKARVYMRWAAQGLKRALSRDISINLRVSLALAAVLALALALLALGQPLVSQPASPQRTGYRPATFVFVVESSSASGTGSVGVVQVAVSYWGVRTLINTRAELEPLCAANVTSEQPVLLGSWKPGAQKVVAFTVNVSKPAPRCDAKLRIWWENTWDDSLATVTHEGGSTELDLGFSTCWGEDLALRAVPSTVYTGAPAQVALEVENRGWFEVSRLTLTVSAQGAAILDSPAPLTFQVGSLPPGKAASFQLAVAPQSAAPALVVTASYLSCSGSLVTRTYTLPLYVASGQAVLVTPDPAVVRAGSSTRLRLHVVNAGGVTLYSVKVLLSLQKSPLSITPSFIDIGELKPGEDKVVEVDVLVPTSASSSEAVGYQVVYSTGSGSSAALQGSFTLSVVFPAGLRIASVEAIPQQPQVGSNVVVAATLVNDGTYPVYAVNVTVSASRGLSPVRAPYAFLGQLSPQVLTSVPFSFRVLEPGVQEVRVVATFRDPYGSVQQVERTVLVNAVPAQQESQGEVRSWNPLLLAAGLAAAVALAVLLLRGRARR